ncbi:MAG: protease inhibitor I42 family protein [Mycobacteriales bacterium]
MSDARPIPAVVGQPVRIPLGDLPASGYEWQLAPATGVRVLAGDDHPGSRSIPGEPVDHVLVVVPDQAGELLLVLRLVRPWEPDQPIRTQTHLLSVRPS